VTFYRVDVDGVRFLAGKLFPAGQLLNDETVVLGRATAPAGHAAGSFRRAASRLESVLGAAPGVTRAMSAFADESVAGLQSITAAFLLGDEQMAQTAAQAMGQTAVPALSPSGTSPVWRGLK